MTAQRFAMKVAPDGRVNWPNLDLEPGTEFEILVMPVDAKDGSADLTTFISADTLRRLWDTPEEDEAWRGF